VVALARWFPWALAALLAAGAAHGAGFDWAPFEQESVIRILTHDEDGDLRDTKIWVVVVDGAGYIRTNASRWLENIRRDPEVQIRLGAYDYLMQAREVTDSATTERVEEAFKEKYGFVQRVMSLFRFREPTVLQLVPRTANPPGSS
jgi:hypothetical protein